MRSEREVELCVLVSRTDATAERIQKATGTATALAHSSTRNECVARIHKPYICTAANGTHNQAGDAGMALHCAGRFDM